MSVGSRTDHIQIARVIGIPIRLLKVREGLAG